MRDFLYMGNNVVVMNFSTEYASNPQELVSSKGFKLFLERYLKDLAIRDIRAYQWVARGREMEEMIAELLKLTKQLLVLDVDEIYNPLFDMLNRSKALYIVEDAYDYWRSKQRFSVFNVSSNPLSFTNFMEADDQYNKAVLQLYRTCEEKLQGKKNRVYRQLQAGTNTSCIVKNYKWEAPYGYTFLKSIPFVNTVMLRTPIMFHSKSNKRTGVFQQADTNPVKTIAMNNQEWLCFPIKISGLLCFVYFHRDFMANGMCLANLFEIASEEECTNAKPDLIVLFGNQDDKDEGVFYFDEINDIWVGSISHDWKVEYFGYMKKIILTLHNLAKMQQQCLPIHGSMMEIYFRNGKRKSLILIGDSGAGKSETIEAVKMLSNSDHSEDRIERIDVIFDDMGSLKVVDDQVVANGTEIGAFVRLDDLDKRTAYQDLERTIFLNPERSNSRLVNPIASYELVSEDHPVDMVLYANNYEDKVGVERFESFQQGKKIFTDGKRMAKGTTQEKGLSSTFFANPFGPMQQAEICSKIMDEIFGKLYQQNVYVGQIFTNLGTEHMENLQLSAQQLLTLLKEQ